MTTLPPKALEAIGILFRRKDQALARAYLESETGLAGQERLLLAVLKCSAGELDQLAAACDLARVDYRDLLMAAGFGYDTVAHQHWQPEPPRNRRTKSDRR